MSATTEALRRRSDQLHGRYRFSFAGKPRVTRRLDELDALIAEARALSEEAERVGEQGGEVGKLLVERVELYTAERANVADAQQAPAQVRQATVLGVRANLHFGVYRRHFAGHDRSTRDLRLLAETIEGLERIAETLGGLQAGPGAARATANLETVQTNLTLYRNEHDAIAAVREAADPDRETSIWANVANRQFEVYKNHFAGQPRISRRPGLLARLIANLRDCEAGMTGLIAVGHQQDTNGKNLDIVRERLTAYSAEMDVLTGAKQQASVFETIDALGNAANDAMAAYGEHFAGRDRASRDLDMLRTLCDQLLEVERQMADIAAVYDNGTNVRNLSIVQDALSTYQDEFEAIRELQAAG